MKASQVKNYFAQIRNQILMFSNNPMTVAAMKAFKLTFYPLQMDLGRDDVQKVAQTLELKRYYMEQFLPKLEKNYPGEVSLTGSRALSRFCRIGIADKGFGKSALNANIKRISPDTWERISRDLLVQARDEKIDKGRKVRIDCTVVESNIHKPFDSIQLFDSVKVLTRLLYKARDEFGIKVAFTDHWRRAKRRMVGIQYAKTMKKRFPLYRIDSKSPKSSSALMA